VVTNRILGLTAGGVDLMGQKDALKAMPVDWLAAGQPDRAPAASRSTP
jgi:hypothetical protein